MTLRDQDRVAGPGRLPCYLVPLLVGMILLAVVLPVQLDRIAYDEIRDAAVAVVLASGEASLDEVWEKAIHPPLVHLLTAGSLFVLPRPLALRAPQVLLGLLAVILVVLLGRRSGRPEVGMVGGLLVASSPIWWSYSAAVSLDLPLAAIAALAALATAGPRRSLGLAVLAGVLAFFAKRQGLVVVGAAMLLATMVHSRQVRLPRWAIVAIPVAILGIAILGVWRYLGFGQELFGITTRLEELVGETPAVLAFACVAAVGLALALWRAEPDGRRYLLPLVVFTVPLACAPLVGSHPAPRYFMPVVPTAAIVVAGAVWFWRGPARPSLRWAVSLILILGASVVQWHDVYHRYWPRQRGHRAAATWLAERVPDRGVVYSPSGKFLELAAWQEAGDVSRIFLSPDVLETEKMVTLVDVDRNTCARLEDLLAAEERPAWVALPLYREFGWLADIEAHAAAMGLRLRALVRRDVARQRDRFPWEDAAVECTGPADGIPVFALLSADAKPDRARLDAAARPALLAGFTTEDRTRAPGVVVDQDGEIQTLRFDGAARDWHHHRGLEIDVHAEQELPSAARLVLRLRSTEVEVPLVELERAAPGTLRLDLRRWSAEETSSVQNLSILTPAGIALRAIRITPD